MQDCPSRAPILLETQNHERVKGAKAEQLLVQLLPPVEIGH